MKPNRITSKILVMTLCLSMVSQQAQAQQNSNNVFDLATTATSSRTDTAQSIVEKLEQQFPSLAPQMQARAKFTTKEQAVAGQLGQLIVPVEEEADAEAPGGLQPEEAEAWRAAANRSPSAQHSQLQLGYPARYDEVMVAEAHGVRAELRALRANAASVEIQDGKPVYREIYRGTDSVQVYRDGQSEEFLLLRDESAPVSFEYELKVSEGAQVLLEDGAVRLVNEEKQGLVIPKPWVVDAKGERREDVVRWVLSEEWTGVRKLVLELMSAGLSYPIAIDPGWMATGNLSAVRIHHTATLLANGKVLVVGGTNANESVCLSSAELYDPATGVWTYTGSLNGGRAGHTATLLANGKVLVAGGAYLDNLISPPDMYSRYSAELYDPATGVWTYAGSLNAARDLHTATLLANGKVLVTGGERKGFLTSRILLDSAELYNPATGVWTPTGNLNTVRLYHTATLLANGKVLVTGGLNGNSLSSAELYHPATGVWTTTGYLNGGRELHKATLLANGKVLVIAGMWSMYNMSTRLNSAELYDPATGVWTYTGSLNVERVGHTATLLANGKVLVAGGYNNGYLRSAELYDPATGVWTPTANLNTGRSRHTAILLANGKVLVALGSGGDTSAELYDSTACPWGACKL